MDITHPDQIHAAFEKAANTGDVDAVLDLYEPDAVNVELDGSQTTGAEALRASVTGLLGALRHLEGTDRKIVIAGGVALLSSSWTAEFVQPDGTVVPAQGITAEVAVRRPDGTWRLVIDDPMFA